MRHDFASEAMMSTFHRVEPGRVKPVLPSKIEGRLPMGQAAVVIAGLSALSWAVLISAIVALRAAL